ncbi:MAG: hypothetical protein HLUCCA04_11145 [Oceanicaulis sp. HLUCCA04]|nr:MAG: hypothetical protein HLUCCA04_11145 [Oceanicaulis sp. HLUCCA04]
MTTHTAAAMARLTVHAVLAAVTGSLFISITGFLTVAAVIWALGMMLGLPLLVIEIGEGLAVIGAIILTVILIRGALALERRRLSGEFV